MSKERVRQCGEVIFDREDSSSASGAVTRNEDTTRSHDG